MNSMKNSKVVSDWKPGLVSNEYRQNYNRIFQQISVVVDENIPFNKIHFYNFERMSSAEYEGVQRRNRWII